MARAALRWSIYDLAGAAGVDYSTIVRFEGGANIRGSSREKIEIALMRGGAAFSCTAGRIAVSVPDGTVK